MIGMMAPLAMIAVLAWQIEPFRLLAWLARPSALVGLLIVNAVVLLFRLFAVADAYRGGHRQRLAPMVVLGGLLALTAAPHLAAGYYDLLTLDAIVDVFPSSHDERPLLDDQGEPRRQVTTTLPVVLKSTPTPANNGA
jgi:hypothetical protein